MKVFHGIKIGGLQQKIFNLMLILLLLLLAAFLFLRSNRRLYDWLMNHPRFGRYIKNFTVHKSIPLHVKIISISTLWLTLLYCAIFVAEHWAFRAFFILIAVGVTIHILSYKTSERK